MLGEKSLTIGIDEILRRISKLKGNQRSDIEPFSVDQSLLAINDLGMRFLKAEVTHAN